MTSGSVLQGDMITWQVLKGMLKIRIIFHNSVMERQLHVECGWYSII